MGISEINELRNRLNTLLVNENASKKEILQLSEELDKLILQFIQDNTK